MAIAARAALRALRRPVCGPLARLLSHSRVRSEIQGVEAVDQWFIFGRELLDQGVRRCHHAVRAGAVPKSLEASLAPLEFQALVDQVKARLELERADLPIGKNGRDDENLLLWFLRDRNFDIDAAVAKLIEALIKPKEKVSVSVFLFEEVKQRARPYLLRSVRIFKELLEVQMKPGWGSSSLFKASSVEEKILQHASFLLLDPRQYKEWRREFGVDEITEASISRVASIGEAYLHKSPAKDGKPVIIVISTKHFPSDALLLESQKHCVYLIEKALKQLPAGGETFLGIFDLRGFQKKNGDLKFVKFLIDVFFKYYPKRLGQVLLVDAPFIFEPWWRMMKPLFGKYAALVRFCSVADLRNEYFTPDTIPDTFKQ